MVMFEDKTSKKDHLIYLLMCQLELYLLKVNR
jgi:hypothetical protein